MKRMGRNSNKLVALVLMGLPIYTCLCLQTVLCNANHIQTTGKKVRKHRQPRKSLQAFPPGHIATAEDAAKVREALLAGKGNDHDDPMILSEYGDIDSVPAMIAVLKRHPANPDGGAICTRWHCLAALKKLTKAGVGNRTEDWEKWWDEYQKGRKIKRNAT